uniref:Hepcidin n=1 Tax=Oncorhynchus mykiss TaxID=8022 RepID=A0A8C7SHY5_ONCMY
MKAFGVACAVDLACMFILESTAVPFSEVWRKNEEVGSIDSPVGEHQQPGGESMRPPVRSIESTSAGWCCSCCHNKGCGFCCKF